MVDKDSGEEALTPMNCTTPWKDLEPSLKLNEIREIIEELDQDGNGTIDFEEFLYMMTSMSMQQIKEAAIHYTNDDSHVLRLGKNDKAYSFRS